MSKAVTEQTYALIEHLRLVMETTAPHERYAVQLIEGELTRLVDAVAQLEEDKAELIAELRELNHFLGCC